MKLSSRLHMVANQITPGKIVADIGTDHGYIPIYQVINDLSPFGYACDVNEGPLERARANVLLYGVEGKISLILSDGLKNLTDIKEKNPQSIVIAGMGGLLIKRILGESMDIAKSADELILSPHSDLAQVRAFLYENGWCIISEDMVKEDGKFYTVIKAIKQEYDMTHGYDVPEELFWAYGRELLLGRHPVLKEMLLKELDTGNRILENLRVNGSGASAFRIKEIQNKQELIAKAMKYF